MIVESATEAFVQILVGASTEQVVTVADPLALDTSYARSHRGPLALEEPDGRLENFLPFA